MTQEDKELLLKDLCARLPYGVKFACNKNVYTAKGFDLIVTDEGDWEYAVTAKGIAPIEIDFIKPYLLPVSSMTKEQRKELRKIRDIVEAKFMNACCKGGFTLSFTNLTDWLNKNHIDYKGLISKGLALDATGLNVY